MPQLWAAGHYTWMLLPDCDKADECLDVCDAYRPLDFQIFTDIGRVQHPNHGSLFSEVPRIHVDRAQGFARYSHQLVLKHIERLQKYGLSRLRES